MAIWLRRAALGWGRSGSKHLMHHATRDRMPVAVRGSRAHRESAHQRMDPVGIRKCTVSGHRVDITLSRQAQPIGGVAPRWCLLTAS